MTAPEDHPSLDLSFLIGNAASRVSYEAFVREFWDEVPGTQPLQWNWHMAAICEELQRLAEGVIAGEPKDHDTIINVPPGTSKSTLCSILFPAWLWAVFPQARILSASHTSDLVLDLANKARFVIKGEKYRAWFPHVEIRPDQDTKGYYANTAGGDRYTCTVAGKSPMGFHAHFIIIDDPIDPKKTASEVELKAAKEFFDAVVPSRKVNKEVSVTIVIMQRLHVEDPTGHLLEKSKRAGAARIKHYCFPAELADPKTRECVAPAEYITAYGEDGLLDPVRLPRSVLNERKTDGAFAYAGQYLQQPFPPGGGMFKETYFGNRVAAVPYNATKARYWDRAFSANDDSCNTCGTLVAHDGAGNWYVGFVKVGKWFSEERDRIIQATAQADRDRWGPQYEPVVVIEQEPSAGADSFRHLARRLAGFNVKADPAKVNKELRADPWASQLAAGNVFLVEDGSWDIPEWIKEHVAFPNGRYKDRVDSASGGFNWLASRRRTGTGFRVLSGPAPGKAKGLRLMVVSREELERTIIGDEWNCLLAVFADPVGREVGHVAEFIRAGDARRVAAADNGSTGDAAPGVPYVNVNTTPIVNGGGPAVEAPAPVKHALTRLAAPAAIIVGADLDPADHQQDWGAPVEPWGLPADKLRLQAAEAKKLWSVLLKQRQPPAQMLVLTDNGGGDRRALSAAYAVCDVLRQPRSLIYRPGDPEAKNEGPAPNLFFYEQVKAARHLVM